MTDLKTVLVGLTTTLGSLLEFELDNCTDLTAEPRVSLILIKAKLDAINEKIKSTDKRDREIVNKLFAELTLKHILAGFHDPEEGGVDKTKFIIDSRSAAETLFKQITTLWPRITFND